MTSEYLSQQTLLEQLRSLRRRIAADVVWTEDPPGVLTTTFPEESDFHHLPDSEKNIVRGIVLFGGVPTRVATGEDAASGDG